MQLGYLVFDVRDVEAWARFATSVLGGMPGSGGGEALGVRLDDAAYRLLLRRGRTDDLAVLGWVLEADEIARLAGRLMRHGVPVTEFSAVECSARSVTAGIRFADPLGLINEAVIGLPRADAPFRSDLMPGGFVARDDLGLGHAVLGCGRRQAEMERFYMEVVGLALTERIDTKIGPVKVDGAFLHCNRRHHSLALIAVPSRKRLLHFMLQAGELRDVGRALERTRAAGIPLSLDLGQHPDPDGTVSFYAPTPSGFDFEIGAGSGEIDPATHVPDIKTRTSDWGHAPSARMKLRGALDLIADRFKRAA